MPKHTAAAARFVQQHLQIQIFGTGARMLCEFCVVFGQCRFGIFSFDEFLIDRISGIDILYDVDVRFAGILSRQIFVEFIVQLLIDFDVVWHIDLIVRMVSTVLFRCFRCVVRCFTGCVQIVHDEFYVGIVIVP